MVETELLQPMDVRLIEQQRSEQAASADICGFQNPPNVQQGISESTSAQQQSAEAVDSHGPQIMMDAKTPFWQRKVEELRPDDFCQLQSLLDAQRDKIHQQLQDLQKVVVLQCRITGTNPLAQEMAAAVLEKRIGKRFGEPLTPKALKCLHNVFSIKDTITKKEAREISALCGATVTQVREFFAGQRSRVRKVVQSSHIDQGSDDMFLKLQSIEPDQSAIFLQHGEDTLLLSSQQVESRQCNHLLLLDGFRGREDGISSKLHAVEKAEHLINVMHKESTFTGQGQLAQVIMQAHESVLRCFMAKGGLQQINKWLIQAAAEEQTSLIRAMLKAITQLPLGSALPRHMSLLLQTVNKLRFYRAQDIASRARLLLSRWSRFFKSSQSGKMVSFTGLARTTQPGQKRSRDSTHSRTIDDGSKKKLKADTVVDSGQSSDLVSSSLTEDKTVQEREKPEAVTEINRTKKRLGSFLIQGDRAKERRKVQLFEESRAAVRRKDGDNTRSSSFESSSRPLSADDIKKAKRRAYFLNSAKAQKPCSLRSDGSITMDLSSFAAEKGQMFAVKNVGNYGGFHESLTREKCLDSKLTFMTGGHLENATKLRIDSKVTNGSAAQDAVLSLCTDGKALNVVNTLVQNVDAHGLATFVQGTCGLESNDGELSMDVKQSELCEAADALDMPSIPWRTPPRIALHPQWKIASGEHSTELLSESKRLRNEVEAIYVSPQCIPPNPQEPAERLCLFVDDAQVAEILLDTLDEESPEKDCSLQSPRDLDMAKVRGEEAESQKLITNLDCKAPGEDLCSSRKGMDMSVALETPSRDTNMSEMITVKDQQLSLQSEISEFDCSNSVTKVNITTDLTKNFYVDPSEFTLATPVEQACLKPRDPENCNLQAYQHGRDTPCLQLTNRDAAPACREQALLESNTLLEVAAAESLSNTPWKKDITSSLQNDNNKASGSFATNMEVPSLQDHSTSSNNTSAVDLSELSKEDCMEMLNIVLQQLTDNAKGSGADLELLSVFLKNPQLVYSLMSSHVGPSSKGSSAASTERCLSDMMMGSTIQDLNNQLEKLVSRNIGQVTNSESLLVKARPHTSQFMQPVRPPVAMGGPQSHPPFSQSMPRSLSAVEPQIQLPNKETKVSDGTQFLKHSSPSSSDYDWSQPYDYPANCMQQGSGLARHSIHTPNTKDNCPNINSYSMTPPGYTLSHLTRASPVHNSSSILAQTDQRLHSSLLMYDGGHVHKNASTLHPERIGRIGSRRPDFPVVDAQHARLLQTGAGFSDGILPVPDISSSNLWVHPSKVMHETHPLHGGKVPTFVPEARGGPAVAGNQMPSYLSNGHHYSDQNFRPQSVQSSRPPYIPHGQMPPSLLMNSVRPQVNSMLWRPPPSRSNHSRHFRPGWKED